MADRERVLAEVRAAIHSEPRLKPGTQIDLDYSEGTLTVSGKVADVAAIDEASPADDADGMAFALERLATDRFRRYDRTDSAVPRGRIAGWRRFESLRRKETSFLSRMSRMIFARAGHIFRSWQKAIATARERIF